MATTTSDGVYIGNLPTLESGTGVSSTGDPISTASASPLLGTYSRAAGMQFFDDLVFETNSGNDIHIYENNITGQSAATLTYGTSEQGCRLRRCSVLRAVFGMGRLVCSDFCAVWAA
jgi:hypothetical protein